jgi:hypothetical protein
VRPDDGAVNDQVFHIRVIGEIGVHLFPDAMVAPAGEALVDAVPIAILLWQKAPLCAGAGYPKNRFNEETTSIFLTDIGA